jgi:hypothetical protein
MSRTLLSGVLVLLLLGSANAEPPRPVLLRAPERGIQPQALFDSKGNLHLLYFRGNAGEGDLFYVRRAVGENAFSAPLQVNSQKGSAIAIGSIRGGQLVLGKNDRVHVVWNGSLSAEPKSPNKSTPLLYARLSDDGKGFEPQRNLMQDSFVLDGGGTVAADRDGHVYVAWHAVKVGEAAGEMNRRVWVAHSSDDGKTFAAETLASTEPTGACGCCGMRGFVDSKGALHLLYRAATRKVNRDMYLLTSTDHGKTFESVLLQRWSLDACPMSSEAFAEGPGGVVLAWETSNQVYFAQLKPGESRPSEPRSPANSRNSKHPALAVTPNGDIVLAWAEGTGWSRGGALAWQVFDGTGRPLGQRGRVEGGIPVWGVPTVAASPTGQVVIVH